MSAQRKPGGWWAKTLTRDTASFMGGWGLMIYEATQAAPFNTTVFLGGMVIAGIPGAVQAFTLWLSARTLPPPSGSAEQLSSEPSHT